MQKENLVRPAQLAGLGLLAGLIGSVAMSLSQRAEMRLTGRAPSQTPAKAVEHITGIDAPGRRSQENLSSAAHLAFGTGLGLGLAALEKLPEPARGIAFFAGAWAAGAGLVTGLGLSDPPTEWDAKELATDLTHHVVYAAGASLAFAGARRLARI